MLYTVVPLKRIYSNMAKSVLDEYKVQSLMPQEESPVYKDVPIAHGKIVLDKKETSTLLVGLIPQICQII